MSVGMSMSRSWRAVSVFFASVMAFCSGSDRSESLNEVSVPSRRIVSIICCPCGGASRFMRIESAMLIVLDTRLALSFAPVRPLLPITAMKASSATFALYARVRAALKSLVTSMLSFLLASVLKRRLRNPTLVSLALPILVACPSEISASWLSPDEAIVLYASIVSMIAPAP